MHVNQELDGHALYLCYFGLREPLVQTQVLPYLREVRRLGIRISLLTFETNPQETWTTDAIEAEKQKLSGEGIEWHFLTYHKTPSVPATVYDVFCGIVFARRLIKNSGVNIIHARSHVAALMGAVIKKITGNKAKLLFDIRGFFPEEYTDAGRWKENGRLYRAVKRAEKWLLKTADGFVVLTEKARAILFPESRETGYDKFGRPVEVIPCCVDLSRFREVSEETRRAMRREYGLENRKVVVYVGSLGTWYMADEMTDFMEAAKKRDSSVFALILTQSPPEIITGLLERKGFAAQDFLVKKVSPNDLAHYLSGADVALSFIKYCYSKLSSSPTKVAEYLAAGVPVVANGGVGDIDEQLEIDASGVVIKDFSSTSYAEALEKIEAIGKLRMSENCKMSAQIRFDLENVGGARYRRLYRRLLQK